MFRIFDRVAAMQDWILTSTYPVGYKKRVVEERVALVRSLKDGKVICKVYGEIGCSKKVCFVQSSHRAAILIGYCRAPVVVALNPFFPVRGGGTIRKFTISAYCRKYSDISGALAKLDLLEPGWGGSQNIGGSPQGKSSALSVDTVISVVMEHLA